MYNSEIEEEPTIIMPLLYKYFMRHCLIAKKGENKKLHLLRSSLVICLHQSLAICGILYILDVYQRNVDIDTKEVVSNIVSFLCQCMLLLWLVWAYEDCYEIMKDIARFDSFGKPAEYERTEEFLNKLVRWLYYVGISIAIVHVLAPLLDSNRCERYNKLHNLAETCGIRSPPPFTRTSTYPHAKTLLRCYQVIGATAGIPIVCLLPCIAYGAHEHLVGKLKHLKRDLTVLSSDEDNKRCSIATFVKHHQYVLRLSDKVNALTSLPLCMHIFVTCSMITLLINAGLHLVWQSPLSVILHGMVWIAALFLNSLGGQKLMDESASLADEIYSGVRWYELDVSIRKDLLIIMIRAQKPLVASTGPFGQMMFPVFLTVLKGVYSFLLASLRRT